MLELGPLEATQTYLLEKLGAEEIVAIEANTTAYLKCLVVKEILGLARAAFLCGDFLPYLRANPRRFDVCIASGVLYHMRSPAELIALVARASDRVLLWTHYYDEERIQAQPHLAPRFTGRAPAVYLGFQHTLYRQEYQQSLDWSGFCGGSAPFSHWMSRDDTLACLRYFGFDDLHVSFGALEHYGGPSFAVAAIRTDPATVPQFDVEEVPEQDTPVRPVQPVAVPAHLAESRGVAELQEALARQDAYIAALEQAVQQKNVHIAGLEGLIRRIENGRAMRLLRLFRR